MKGLINNTQFGYYGNTKCSSPYTCMIYIYCNNNINNNITIVTNTVITVSFTGNSKSQSMVYYFVIITIS